MNEPIIADGEFLFILAEPLAETDLLSIAKQCDQTGFHKKLQTRLRLEEKGS